MIRPFIRPARLPLALAALLIVGSFGLGLAPLKDLKVDVSDVQLAPVPVIDREIAGDYSTLAAIIVSRPLFVEGRQAALSVDGAGSALGELRLAGTIANSRVKKALFRELAESGEGKRGVWVGVGEEISGWRVIAIEAGRTTLRRGQEEVVLSISKRKALTPKQVSQLRAATPITPSERTNVGRAASQARAEELKETLSRLDEGEIFGTPN